MGQGWLLSKAGLALLLMLGRLKNDGLPQDPQQIVTVTGYLVELGCLTIQSGATVEFLHTAGCVRSKSSTAARFALMMRDAAHTAYRLDPGANARLLKFAGMLEDHHNVLITVAGSLNKNRAIIASLISEPTVEEIRKWR